MVFNSECIFRFIVMFYHFQRDKPELLISQTYSHTLRYIIIFHVGTVKLLRYLQTCYIFLFTITSTLRRAQRNSFFYSQTLYQRDWVGGKEYRVSNCSKYSRLLHQLIGCRKFFYRVSAPQYCLCMNVSLCLWVLEFVYVWAVVCGSTFTREYADCVL